MGNGKKLTKLEECCQATLSLIITKALSRRFLHVSSKSYKVILISLSFSSKIEAVDISIDFHKSKSPRE